jgi:hypothetical protein
MTSSSEASETIPPPKYSEHEFHWLVAERAWSPVPSQWIRGYWYSPGEGGAISPAEMWRRGCRALPTPTAWRRAARRLARRGNSDSRPSRRDLVAADRAFVEQYVKELGK